MIKFQQSDIHYSNICNLYKVSTKTILSSSIEVA